MEWFSKYERKQRKNKLGKIILFKTIKYFVKKFVVIYFSVIIILHSFIASRRSFNETV